RGGGAAGADVRGGRGRGRALARRRDARRRGRGRGRGGGGAGRPRGSGRRAGEWYVEPPGPSPLSAGLAGIAWDSLPPATVLADVPGDSAGVAVLTARLGRRGPPRPVVWVASAAGARRAVIA